MRTTTRTATVLFTDLVGSTELLARTGAVEADRLRTAFFGRMRDVLAVHRGTEVKTLGDGLMAVFDSAGDALGCAVTMQQAVAAHNRRGDGDHLQLRVGLSAGETTVEDDDYFGMPVVEASRLCAAAEPGQVLAADVVRILVGSTTAHELTPVGPLMLKGMPAPTVVWTVGWDASQDFTLRVALADDSALLRQGIASILEAASFDVVLEAGDAEELLRGVPAARPHVVVVDVRMPPTHTTEGLDAAERIRADYPDIGVVVLSATIDPRAARRLLSGSTDGIGYLLKDRVADVEELAAAIRTVARGGAAIDPEVLTRLRALAPVD